MQINAVHSPCFFCDDLWHGRHLGVTLRDINAIDRVVRSRFQDQSALAVQQVVRNRQRETNAAVSYHSTCSRYDPTALTPCRSCGQVVALAVDSVHALRKDSGVDIASLLKLKLKVEPIRLHIDGGLWTRCNRFFHDTSPRPPVHPRPDDARFQLVELDGLNIIADYVRALGLLATHLGRILA